MKKTKWYPGNVKPVHVGVYETAKRNGMDWFQFWDGKRWGWAAPTPERAFRFRDVCSAHQFEDWRGLTKPA